MNIPFRKSDAQDPAPRMPLYGSREWPSIMTAVHERADILALVEDDPETDEALQNAHLEVLRSADVNVAAAIASELGHASVRDVDARSAYLLRLEFMRVVISRRVEHQKDALQRMRIAVSMAEAELIFGSGA